MKVEDNDLVIEKDNFGRIISVQVLQFTICHDDFTSLDDVESFIKHLNTTDNFLSSHPIILSLCQYSEIKENNNAPFLTGTDFDSFISSINNYLDRNIKQETKGKKIKSAIDIKNNARISGTMPWVYRLSYDIKK